MDFQAHVATLFFEFVQHVVYDFFVILVPVISQEFAYYIFKSNPCFFFQYSTLLFQTFHPK
jgi:hypothetical protein